MGHIIGIGFHLFALILETVKVHNMKNLHLVFFFYLLRLVFITDNLSKYAWRVYLPSRWSLNYVTCDAVCGADDAGAACADAVSCADGMPMSCYVGGAQSCVSWSCNRCRNRHGDGLGYTRWCHGLVNPNVFDNSHYLDRTHHNWNFVKAFLTNSRK